MSRHVKPCISRNFGQVVTETPYRPEWVNAIKFVIPNEHRRYDSMDGVWSFSPIYYSAVRTITEWYFGTSIIDATGGIPEPQSQSWKERWEVYKANDEKQEYQRQREPQARPASSDAYATLFVAANAPSCVIKAAYRALAAENHPDKGGDTEIMARINRAFDELKKKGRVS